MNEQIDIQILSEQLVTSVMNSQSFSNPEKLKDHDAVINLCSNYLNSLVELKESLKIGGTELLLLLQYEFDVLCRAMLHPSNELSVDQLQTIIEVEASGTSSTLQSLYSIEIEQLMSESPCMIELTGDLLEQSRMLLCKLIESEIEEGNADAIVLWKVAAASYFAMYISMRKWKKLN